MILDCNSTKGGVDNIDKVTATYSCQRKTAHWPLVIFYNIVDVSAYNAYVLWTGINQQWNVANCTDICFSWENWAKALSLPNSNGEPGQLGPQQLQLSLKSLIISMRSHKVNGQNEM
ncbi:hypothetical protein Q8A73_015781 [Channa argus]|nr:hypothetical protein Q8A73_015781 [Channa argus]